MRHVLIVFALLACGACASITSAVGPQIAKGVKKYCLEPLAERQLIRAQVNQQIAPNTIKVTCEGDPE